MNKHKEKKPTLNEFDSYAENYAQTLDHYCAATGEQSTYFVNLRAQKLQEWLNSFSFSPAYILDFGCGDGSMTYEVKKLFPEASIFGVDPSEKSINIARKRTSSIIFDLSSETIPYQDAQFDVVYAAAVFHHIPFDLHEHYMQECKRVLKLNGLLILFELNPLNPGTRYIFKNNPMDENATMLTPWYTKKLIRPLTYKKTIFYCFFPHFLRFLRPLDQWLSWIPLGGLYGMIAQKESAT